MCSLTLLLLLAVVVAYVCRKGMVAPFHFLSQTAYQLGKTKAELGSFCLVGLLSGEYFNNIRLVLVCVMLCMSWFGGIPLYD